ncbi:oxygen-independent coproporphyrinogen III oxidase [Plebeiibacterium sediminum]|uniref:Coproporphyrinogen-III oxidase n=1 Tax=Plebeiibacterium sediminum TaxID=2992112 RepID=A0AAE3M2C1_9BACT|nr:oxygen-independent coproporphyrinogen III oxidase [Plebeiobacterium sediminum]MCW3785455.1 oxygen-independent coproporphyrinogen III oxidase [Plebeiobacterium sediminum]
MKVTKELLDKYNIPVPRYTSYPPANYFTNDFTLDNYHELIELSNTDDPKLVAFYIHIPFCAQICYYCGCNALKMEKSDVVFQYVEAVKKEILMLSKRIDKSRKVSQIHYGGGTPNAIKSEYLKEINQTIFNEFDLIDEVEIAIECNPALLSYTYLDALIEAKFNRFSFGIQDFNNDVLTNVNRKPSALPVKELVEYVKEKNSKVAVNLDFIYGLPGQSLDSFKDTINKAIEIKPDRLVTFSYAHVPWLKENQKILEEKGLPTADEKMDMFMAAYDLLTTAGYISIGLDHYALPQDELCVALEQHQLHRNFQGYCTKKTTGQVYAVGISGISQLAGGYIQNTKELSSYTKSIADGAFPVEKGIVVTQEQKVIRMVINELMCNKVLVWNEIADIFKLTVNEVKAIVKYSEKAMNDFKADELIEFEDNQIRINELGSLFIRNIVAAFDPALKNNEKRYSKSL